MNRHPFFWDRGVAFKALRPLGLLHIWLMYGHITVAGEEITDEDPCILAPTHTGRFTDILLTHYASSTPARKDRYLNVAWAGFIRSEFLLYHLHMLPLENQFGGGTKSGNLGKAFKQINLMTAYLQGLSEDGEFESKAILFFPSGKCGTGRFEEPWKQGVARVIGKFLLENDRDLTVYLVPINYESYLNHFHSDVELHTRLIRLGSEWREKFRKNEKRTRREVLRFLIEETQKACVWHTFEAPPLSEIEAGLLSEDQSSKAVQNLSSLSNEQDWQQFRKCLTEESSATAKSEAYQKLIAQIKTRITFQEDMLIAALRGSIPSVLERTRLAGQLLENSEWKLTEDLEEALFEYEYLLNKLAIPYGHETETVNWKLIALAPLALMSLILYVPAWLLQATVAPPFDRLFEKQPHLIQFRGEDAVWKMLGGWGVIYLAIFASGFFAAAHIFQAPLAIEIIYGSVWAFISLIATFLTGATGFKMGWRYRLLWLRLIKNKGLKRVDTLRNYILQKLAG